MAKILSTKLSKNWKDRAAGYSSHSVIFNCGHPGRLFGTVDRVKAFAGNCSACSRLEDEAADKAARKYYDQLRSIEKS